MLRLIINLFFLFLYNFSFSQTSELGRFTVNVKNGCLPLEIEIVSENLDTSISVVQYDFDYNQTNNLFNPSSSKSHTYNSRLAQEIGAWAQTIDNETTIHDNFFEAYFVNGLNVGLENVILDVVSKSGLDIEEAKNVIKNRLFKKNIDEDWNKSRNYGVAGVPTYVYEKQSMVGAQPFENLVEFLNHFDVSKW